MERPPERATRAAKNLSVTIPLLALVRERHISLTFKTMLKVSGQCAGSGQYKSYQPDPGPLPPCTRRDGGTRVEDPNK
eukprot:2998750-Lingulodinium_polyedra.AAC.1